jgi:CheY-like chemotaxis protein
MNRVQSIESLRNKKKKLKILIVDDEIDSSSLFKEILDLRGHNVTLINEGIQCINKCKDNEYDIIFLDYHIPGIDGVVIADLIKDLFKTNSLIFAYTGDSTTESLNKFKKIGMTAALIKPVDIDLINLIMNSFEERECIDKNILHKLSKKHKNTLYIF